MKPTDHTITLLCLLGGFTLALFSAELLSAQERPPFPPGPPGMDRPAESGSAEGREQVQERIRVMRAWRLTEVLELDDQTGIALFELLDELDSTLEPQQNQMRELGQELRTHLSEGSGSDEEIANLVEELMNTHLGIEQLRVETIQSAAEILTPRQQATLMLFLPEFDREVRQMVREVRRERRERRSDSSEGSRREHRRRERQQTEEPTETN